MKKLLSIIGALGLTATSAMAVVACGNDESTPNQKEDEKAIANIIKVGENGNFRNAFAHKAPDAGDLNTILKVQYPDLKVEELTITVDQTTQMIKIVVNDNSTTYTPKTSVELPYYISGRSDVRNIFTTANLGDFSHVPTNAELMTKLKETNPGLEVDEVQIDVNGGAWTGGDKYFRADVSVKDSSTNYNRSWVNAFYTINGMGYKAFNEIEANKPSGTNKVSEILKADTANVSEKDGVITVKLLDANTGYQMHPSAQDLLDSVKKQYADIKIENFQVIDNQAEGNAKIRVIPTSKEYSDETFTVTYTREVNITTKNTSGKLVEGVNTGIWLRNIGEIEVANADAIPSWDQIKAAIGTANKALNPALLEEMELVKDPTKQYAEVKPKADAKTYSQIGTVFVHYTLKVKAA